ncbi:MAG: nucleotidyltransferase domain-containing protein [Pseudomonadota bacterium]
MNHGLTSEQLRLIQSVLAPYADSIEQVSLFGSRAMGTYRPDSDIDLVLHGDIPEASIGRLHTLFQESALPVSVDVKSYEHTTYPPLRQHMNECMQPLFNRRQLQRYS